MFLAKHLKTAKRLWNKILKAFPNWSLISVPFVKVELIDLKVGSAHTASLFSLYLTNFTYNVLRNHLIPFFDHTVVWRKYLISSLLSLKIGQCPTDFPGSAPALWFPMLSPVPFYFLNRSAYVCVCQCSYRRHLFFDCKGARGRGGDTSGIRVLPQRRIGKKISIESKVSSGYTSCTYRFLRLELLADLSFMHYRHFLYSEQW